MMIRKQACLALSAFLLALPATTLAADPKGAKSTPPSKAASAKRTVAATVNGSPIYVDQLDVVIDARNKGQKLHPSQRDLQRKTLLQEAISTELLYQEAMRNKSPELEKKVSAREKELREKHPELFKGKDPEQIRHNLRQNIAIQDLLHRGGYIDPEIPDKETRALYEKLKEQMKYPESFHVRQVFVKVDPKASAEEKKKARRKIEEARGQIVKGEPFEKVAKKDSEDLAAKGGGDLGYIFPGFMPEPFEKAAFSLPKGKLSEIIETQYGYHVLEVLDKKPAGVASYDEKKDWLRNYLKEQTRARKMNDLMARLKKQATIQIHLK